MLRRRGQQPACPLARETTTVSTQRRCPGAIGRDTAPGLGLSWMAPAVRNQRQQRGASASAYGTACQAAAGGWLALAVTDMIMDYLQCHLQRLLGRRRRRQWISLSLSVVICSGGSCIVLYQSRSLSRNFLLKGLLKIKTWSFALTRSKL